MLLHSSWIFKVDTDPLKPFLSLPTFCVLFFQETRQFDRPDWPTWKKVRCCPFRDPTLEEEVDRRENGIIIAKMKKDQTLKVICKAKILCCATTKSQKFLKTKDFGE